MNDALVKHGPPGPVQPLSGEWGSSNVLFDGGDIAGLDVLECHIYILGTGPCGEHILGVS